MFNEIGESKMNGSAIMPAGKYYVGDLCYVMHKEWDEFCGLTIKDNECLQGKFTLSDGREFVSFNTAWGDGAYFDQRRNEYSVDAGLIGCIKLEDCCREEGEDTSGGQIVEFKHDFICSSQDGVLSFGHIVIDTDSVEEEEDDYAY